MGSAHVLPAGATALILSSRPCFDTVSSSSYESSSIRSWAIRRHEAKPNAFSAPGGNVYVADALLYLVKNTEELAGTLYHEVSHTSASGNATDRRTRDVAEC